MAGRIKGITVEIGGDTTGLETALSDVNRQSKSLQNELKEVQRALKFDPGNTTLIAQQQQILGERIAATSQKLQQLKSVQSQVEQQFQSGQLGVEQYRAFQRELQSTEGQLNGLRTQLQQSQQTMQDLARNTQDLETYFNATGTTVADFADVLGNKLTTAIQNGTASAAQIDQAITKIGQAAVGADVDVERFRTALQQVGEGGSIAQVADDIQQMRNELTPVPSVVDNVRASLQSVEATSSGLTAELKQVQAALRLDPNNITLVRQQQDLLGQSIQQTEQKLDGLKQAQQEVEAAFASGDLGVAEYRAFQRELGQTEAQLSNLNSALQRSQSEQQAVASSTQQLNRFFEATGTSVQDFANVIGPELAASISQGRASSQQLERALTQIGQEALGAGADLDRLRSALQQVGNGGDLSRLQQELQDIERQAGQTEEAVSGIGDGIKEGIAALAGAGGLAATVQQALDVSSLDTKIDIVFDVPESSKASVRDAINGVKNYGVDAEEALEGVRKQWALNKDASDQTNAAVVKAAGVIATSYSGVDFAELIQETNELAAGLKISNTDAIALANSLLKAGFPPDEIDTMAEYGLQMKQAGFSAAEIQAIFEKGIDTKSWNMDNLNDGVKNARIEMAAFGQEVPKSMSDLLSQTDISSKQFQQWGRDVAEGGTKGSEAMSDMANWLDGIEDKSLKNALATEIFTTQWEDQGPNMISVLQGIGNAQDKTKENTEEMAANMERLDADPLVRIREALTDIQTALAPVLGSIAEFIAQIADWISNNQTLAATITAVVAVIGMIVAAFMTLAPIFTVIGTLMAGVGASFAAIAAPVAIAIAAIAALVAAGVLIYSNWGAIKEFFSNLWTSISTIFMTTVTAIGSFLSSAWSSIVAALTAVWTSIVGIAQTTWGALTAFFSTLWTGISTVFTAIWIVIKAALELAWQGIVTAAQTIFGLLAPYFMTLWSGITSVFSTVWAAISTVLTTIWTAIVSAGQTIWTGLVTFFGPLWSGVSAVFSAAWSAISSVLTSVWSAISATASSVWNGIKATLSSIWNSLTGVATAAFNAIKNVVTTIFNAIKSVTTTVWAGIKSIIASNADGSKAVISTAFNAMKAVVTSVWNGIKSVTSSVWNGIKSVLTAVWNGIKATATTVFNAIKNVITTVWNGVKSVATSVWNAIKSTLTTIWNSLKSVATSAFNAVKTTITTIFNSIKSTASSVWNSIKSSLTSIWNSLKSVASSTFNSMKSTITSIFNAIKSVATSVWNGIKSTVTSAVNGIRSVVTSVFNSVRSTVTSVMNSVKSVITSTWNSAKSVVTSAVNAIRSIVTSVFSSLRAVVSSAMQGVVSAIRSGWSAAQSFLTSINLVSIGKNIIQGLVNGIKSGVGAVGAAISEVASNIKGKIKGALGIHSPSRWMRDEIGKNIDAGLAKGITAEKKAEQAAAKKAKAVKDQFTKDLKNVQLKFNAGKIDTKEYIGQLNKLKTEYKNYSDGIKKIDVEINKANKKQTATIKSDYSARLKELKNNYNADLISNKEYISALQKMKADYGKKVKGSESELNAKIKELRDSAAADNLKRYEKQINEEDKYNNASLNKQIAFWKKRLSKFKENSEEYLSVQDKIKELTFAKEAERLQKYEATFNEEVKYNDMSLANQIAYWQKRITKFKTGSDEEIAIQDKLKDLRYQSEQGALTATQTYLDNVLALDAEYVKEVQALTDEYTKTVDDRAKAIVDFAGIFEEIDLGEAIAGSQLIANLQSQTDLIEDWMTDLAALTEKGLDAGLLAELQALGPKSAKEIKALTTLSDKELKQYTDLWKKKSELAKTQALKETESLKKDTEKKIDDLNNKTKAQLDTYKNEWQTSMKAVTKVAADELGLLKNISKKSVQDIIDSVEGGKIQSKAVMEELAGLITTAADNKLSGLKKIGKDSLEDMRKVMKDKEDMLVEVGKNVAQGLVDGINSKKDEIKKASEDLSKVVLDTTKEELDIHSPSRKMFELGEYTAEGLALGIKAKSDKVTDNVKEMTDAVEKEYYKAIDKLWAEYAEIPYEERDHSWYTERLEKIKKTYDGMSALNTEYTSKVLAANEKLAESEKKLNDEYTKAVADRAKSIYNATSLFDAVTEKTEKTGAELTSNLKGQLDAMKNYSNSIASLSARGLDAELLDELQDMGVKSAGEIEALNKMSDAELNAYVSLWKEKTALANTLATNELSSMRKETDEQIVQLRRDTMDELDGYKDDWLKSIEEIATGSLMSFYNLSNSLTQIGSDMMQNLIDAMLAKKQALKDAVQEVKDVVNSSNSIASTKPEVEGVQTGSITLPTYKAVAAKVSSALASVQASAIKSVSALQSSTINNSSSSVSTDNSRKQQNTINVYTQESPERAIERTLRRQSFAL